MIIRAPTRTKTSSFHGQQMSFKFPSTESLRDATLDEYHLNNHHLLNDNVNKNYDEVASQVLSEYTSASNTNTNSGHSSNGYYSFANISDNTTSSPKPNAINHRYSAISSENIHSMDIQGAKTPVLEPASDHFKFPSRSSPSSPMEVIPEGNGFTSFSTALQSIPTAANISYDIASTSSSHSSMKSDNTTKRKPANKLQRTPTITRVESTVSTRSSWESGRRPSKLKRSKAIRCKGGLLQYFILLGLKLKKQLRKVISSIRNKLNRRRKSEYQSSRLSSSQADGSSTVGAQQRRSRQRDLKTSHLKRTQRYVSNLQRSMSCKSLQPVLMPKVSSTNEISDHVKGITDISKTELVRNPTTSLRRTNSSIKRAASVITTSHKISDTAKGSLSESPVAAIEENANEQEIKSPNRQGIVRSVGSHSLSSLARQPSIVVKNKVIPLSMRHYSIKEEEEDEGEDEYVISTNSMRPLTPVDSENSDDDAYEDAQGFPSVSQSDEENQLSQSFNHYFRTIISQRIMMRLQIAKYQNCGLPASDFIGSFIREYESDSSASNLFEEHKSYVLTTDATSEELEEEEDEEDEASSSYSTNNSLTFTFNSPFGGANRLNHRDSLLSLPSATVKRSLTLPIGIKV